MSALELKEFEGIESEGSSKGFDWQDFLLKYKFETLFLLVGLILIGFGALFLSRGDNVTGDGIEILESATDTEGSGKIVVEVVGAVEAPGVFGLATDSRVEDALILAGGVAADADRIWMEKTLNRAAKVTDGQKIYIPRTSEQPDSVSANNSSGGQSGSAVLGGQGSGLTNINSASQKELESLSGIGPVYAQNIIEQRPYSTVQELVSKGAIKQYVLDKISDKVSIY